MIAPRFHIPGLSASAAEGLFILKPNSTTVEINVATTGNDTTGNGSAGNPFLTWQKGFDVAATFRSLVAINIIVAAGTYTEQVVVPPALQGNVTVTGDTTTPSNVVLDADGVFTNTAISLIQGSAIVRLEGIRIINALFGAEVVGQTLELGFVEFDDCFLNLFPFDNAVVNFIANGDGDSTMTSTGGAGTFNVVMGRQTSIIMSQDVTWDDAQICIRCTDTSVLSTSFGFTQTFTPTAAAITAIEVTAYSFFAMTSDIVITAAAKAAGSAGMQITDSVVSGVSTGSVSIENFTTGILGRGVSNYIHSGGVYTYTNVDTDVEFGYAVVFTTDDDFDTQIQLNNVLNEQYAYDTRAFYQRMQYN